LTQDPPLLNALAKAGVRLSPTWQWRPRHWVALVRALVAVLVGGALLLDLLPRIVAVLPLATCEDHLGS
jgi:hypothetical protein